MTEPLTDAEWVQFALWAHRNPIVAEHAGTLRLMGALKAAMEQLAALEVVVRNQQFTIGGHEAIARVATKHNANGCFVDWPVVGTMHTRTTAGPLVSSGRSMARSLPGQRPTRRHSLLPLLPPRRVGTRPHE
jgi:hypothetical protein